MRGVRLAFFNGEGQRLMGYDDWFSDAVLDEIRRTGDALVAHADAFTSPHPVPLVPVSDDRVLANAFPLDDQAVWTLFNASDEDVDGVVLELDARPGSAWADCLTGEELDPEITNGFARIELSVPAGDVGCVHAVWDVEPATLLAEFDSLGALGEQPDLDALTDGFSVAAWVDPAEVGGVRRILASEGWDSGGWVFGLTEDDGQPALAFTTIGVQDHVVRAVVPTDRWTHVAAVVDAGHSVTFYVDGHRRGVVHGDTPGLTGESVWHVGSNGIDGAFDGELEVQVWDGELTAAEVLALADVTPPLAGTIRVADAGASPVELWWSGFHDPGSGIGDYRVEVDGEVRSTDQVSGVFDLAPGSHLVQVTAQDGVGLTTTVEATIEVTAAELLHVFGGAVDVPGDDWSVRAPDLEGALVEAADWSLHRDADGVRLELADETLSVPVEAGGDLVIHLDRFTTLRVWRDGVAAGLAHGTLPPDGGAALGAEGVEIWRGRLDPSHEADDTGVDAPGPQDDPRCGCRSGSAALLLGLIVTLRRRSAY